MSEPVSDILARLTVAMRPHAASPVAATRRASDSPAVTTGDRGSVLSGTMRGYGRHPQQRIKRPGTGGPSTFRPTAAYWAGSAVPATARVPRGQVSRVQGQKIVQGNRALAVATAQDARLREAWRAYLNQRIAAGEPF